MYQWEYNKDDPMYQWEHIKDGKHIKDGLLMRKIKNSVSQFQCPECHAIFFCETKPIPSLTFKVSQYVFDKEFKVKCPICNLEWDVRVLSA